MYKDYQIQFWGEYGEIEGSLDISAETQLQAESVAAKLSEAILPIIQQHNRDIGIIPPSKLTPRVTAYKTSTF